MTKNQTQLDLDVKMPAEFADVLRRAAEMYRRKNDGDIWVDLADILEVAADSADAAITRHLDARTFGQ